MGYLTSQGSVYSLKKRGKRYVKPLANRSEFLRPGQKEAEPSSEEREGSPCTRPVRLVSKRSWTGRLPDQQRGQRAQRHGAGLVIDPLKSNSRGGQE